MSFQHFLSMHPAASTRSLWAKAGNLSFSRLHIWTAFQVGNWERGEREEGKVERREAQRVGTRTCIWGILSWKLRKLLGVHDDTVGSVMMTLPVVLRRLQQNDRSNRTIRDGCSQSEGWDVRRVFLSVDKQKKTSSQEANNGPSSVCECFSTSSGEITRAHASSRELTRAALWDQSVLRWMVRIKALLGH